MWVFIAFLPPTRYREVSHIRVFIRWIRRAIGGGGVDVGGGGFDGGGDGGGGGNIVGGGVRYGIVRVNGWTGRGTVRDTNRNSSGHEHEHCGVRLWPMLVVGAGLLVGAVVRMSWEGDVAVGNVVWVLLSEEIVGGV